MQRLLKGAATVAVVAAGLASAPEAHAIEDANMWGVGVKVGTIAIPGRFPLSFPSKISGYNFIDEGAQAGNENGDDPKRDLDANGDPIFSALERVRWDGQFSVDGFYGIDRDNRVGAMAGFAAGTGYSDMFFLLNYDRVLVSESDIDIVAGPYIGVGQMRFKDPNGGPESLKVPHFPLRGHVMAQLRAKKTAYALGLFGGTNVPSNHYYTDVDGLERDDVGSPFNVALYLHAGIEFSVQYGDFTPPKKKKKGGGSKKKGKK